MWSKLGPSEKAIVVMVGIFSALSILSGFFYLLTLVLGPFGPMYFILGLCLVGGFLLIRSAFKLQEKLDARYEPKKNRYGKMNR